MAEVPLPRQAADDDPSNRSCGSPSLASLVLAYHPAVYRYAYRLTGSAVDAEDLTQQTFLVAHQRVGQLREPECAGGWLLAIARTCYLKSRAKRQPEASDDELTALTAPNHEIEHFDREELQRALNDLPDDLRVVLVMYYFEDLSYREIASELEIAIGTVMSRLSRAKDRLRERLGTKFPKSSLGRKGTSATDYQAHRPTHTTP